MKKFIQSIFGLWGYELNKIQSTQIHSMSAGLARLKKKGFNPATIIDLGAAQGSWSVLAMSFWKNAQYLLFEPLTERRDELEELKSNHQNIHLIFAGAGKEKGTINFSVTRDLDGSGVYENHQSATLRTIQVRTIDEEINLSGLKPPYLIKFDTHGFEVPILEGAKSVLQQTEIIIMECYGFRISKNCLLLHEMCAYLEKIGFRLADILDVSRRPGDEFFWQCDLFFLRSSHPSFQRNTHK